MYMQVKIKTYKDYNVTDKNLWDLYQEDFAAFQKDTFKAVKSIYLQRFRDLLHLQGVYIQLNNRALSLPQTLIKILQKENPQDWPNKEIKAAKLSQSNAIQKCIQRQGPNKSRPSATLQEPAPQATATTTQTTP